MAKPSENPKRWSPVVIAAIITAVAAIIVATIKLIPEYWSPSPAEVNITTHVSDSTSGTSIQGAKTILLLEGNSYTEYTDSNGNVTFRVNTAEKGDARLFVENAGYEIYDKSIGLSKALFVDIRLLSENSNNRKIIARVVDDSTSLPIEGAKVVFVANGENYSKTTDSNGIAIFTIEFTSETIDVDITVSTADYEINRQQVTVRPDQVQDIRLNNSSKELSVVPFESSESPSTGATDGTIAYDQIFSGSITEATQKDRYTFIGNPGDVILITLAITEGDIWPEIRLFNPEGSEIKTARAPGASVELNETLSDAGEFIILIGDGHDGTLTGQYTLNLQKIR